MSASRSPFKALKNGFDAFFRRDLSLRRADGGLRLVLAERGAGPSEAPPTPEELARRRLERELLQAREDLTRLLDEDVAARSTMRHLAVVEHALGRIGWQALERVPLDVLQRALEQFEERVTNWSPTGLACLRSRLAVAVAERQRREPDASAHDAAALEPPSMLAAQAITRARGDAEPAEDDAADALRAAYAAMGVESPAAGPR